MCYPSGMVNQSEAEAAQVCREAIDEILPFVGALSDANRKLVVGVIERLTQRLT